LQALGLSFLLIIFAAATFWFFAFLVPGQRQAAIDGWRQQLSQRADNRRDLLDRRISEGVEDARFFAMFPSVRAIVSFGPHGSSGVGSSPHISGILSDCLNVYGYRSVSICDAAGAVLVSSDGPAPGADAVATAREAARTGEPWVDLVREPDGFIALAVAAPVRENDQNARTGGALLVVTNAEEGLFDILRRPVSTATGEAVLVRRKGDSALYLSPLRFRPDPPLTFRRALKEPDFAARLALEGGDVFGSFVDYRGVKVFAAGRRLKRAPWSLVVKVDEEEALAPVRKDVRQKGITWAALLLALCAAAAASARSLLLAHETALARSEARSHENVIRLNAELEEALAWQRQIFEGSRDAVFVSDEEARFVAVNGAATELTGYSHDELLGMGIPDLHEEPDLAAYRAFHQRILGGEQILSEAPIRKKDGSKVAVEFNNRLVTIGGRRFMHTAGRDVTERKQLEAQLVQAQKMEAVGRLAGGVAHDFNNLLTVIQGYGELLHASLANDPERRESLVEIVKAAERAAALTRQLLAFSRKQVLEPKVVHLGEIVRETGRMLERLIGEGIALAFVVSEDVATVKADPGQIEQVVLNLAVNARDAMPSGGQLAVSVGSLTTAIPLEGFPDQLPAGRWVLLTMEDTGSGMDAETLSHAFEPFFTTKERGKGTGLGLSTVYGIVRQSGGHVQLMSVPGKGTTFQIYLPRSDERRVSGAHSSVSAVPGSETVLVVEDEPAVRSLVQTVLERHGYIVLVAEDGAGALDVVDKHPGPIHVLLTDIVMPGMNGRDLAGVVTARRPSIRVIFMSGYTADIPTDLGVEGGPLFLSKPFSEQALTSKLREAFDAPPA
jgi:PAS domain S-box-containing protein